ncbi:recombinase family protein [Kitasatospora sp. NBC_01287]|uniref:recombinase family protein n=1 Tax=Kitasatospora sp. NBC_01287 TaxID=2903573 RepID=UPI002250953E|nr:recombinase family protein [Kitasatospora sp. NBC_01287]MCX4750847.1 recombinase family protein [Kitasatospora sp. NBC_01287]
MPAASPASDPARRAAVYCWPLTGATSRDGQDSLDLQESLARERSAALGLTLAARHVFTDARPPAALSPAAQPGWAALLDAVTAQEFGHLFLHQAERLAEHPCALTELLTLATRHGLRLHGHPQDLDDPAVRAALLRPAERACRAARLSSERARTAHRAAAEAGRTHGGGLRPFGYAAGMAELVEAEAVVVRELFARFLAGESLRALALDLNHRRIPTAYGKNWTVSGVGRLIAAPRYAGLRLLAGGIVRSPEGGYLSAGWPACVSVADWEAAGELRSRRAREQAATSRPRRVYPLTSLVRCTRCERHMVGSMVGTYPTYACTSSSSLEADRCSRHIGAESLEAHVTERAIALLEALAPDRAEPPADGAHPRAPSRPVPSPPAPSAQPQPPHRALHRALHGALHGVPLGAAARSGWSGLTPARKAAVFRHLFASIRISASATSRGVFDPTRIEIRPRTHRPATGPATP